MMVCTVTGLLFCGPEEYN